MLLKPPSSDPVIPPQLPYLPLSPERSPCCCTASVPLVFSTPSHINCPDCPSYLEQAHVVVGSPQLCKGHLAGKALVHDTAQGVDVRAHVNLERGRRAGVGRGMDVRAHANLEGGAQVGEGEGEKQGELVPGGWGKTCDGRGGRGRGQSGKGGAYGLGRDLTCGHQVHLRMTGWRGNNTFTCTQTHGQDPRILVCRRATSNQLESRAPQL